MDESKYSESYAFSAKMIEIPKAEHINFRDIAASLAKQCAFQGNTHVFYSLAQHSCLIADIVHDHFSQQASVSLNAIMLFCPYTFMGNASLYTKNKEYELTIDRIDREINSSINFNEKNFRYDFLQNAVLMADNTAKRDVLSPDKYPDMPTASPYKHPIQPVDWMKAEEIYLKKLTQLITQSGLVLPLELEVF